MPTELVTIREVLDRLEEPDDANGDLQRVIASVSAEVIQLTGDRFSVEERDEMLDGEGETLMLTFHPVDLDEDFVLTDRQDDTAPIAETDYDVDSDAGLVYRASDDVPSGEDWEPGKRRFRAQYTGGYDGVPADLKAAVLDLIADRWKNRVPHDTSSARAGVQSSRMDAIPNRILQVLEPYLLQEL